MLRIGSFADMGRKLRIEYPGAIYHVMNRGDRREAIFHDDDDRLVFLETLEEACEKTGWQVHALCLMSNHFHLVPETPQANLVDGMKWFLGTYTKRFNRRHQMFGHLFSGRYKALIVDGSGSGYLRTACDYVHLNPQRAGLLAPDQKLSAYRWSSYAEYLKSPGRRKRWLRVDRLFGEVGIPKDSPAGRREFERRMELRRLESDPEQWKQLRRGWCVGDDTFRKELLERIDQRHGPNHYGDDRHESAQARAERIVLEELQRLGWSEQTLAQTRKGHPSKLGVALRLRRETTMTLIWIAERLRMGTRTHVAHLLYWHSRRCESDRMSTGAVIRQEVYNTRN
jgi:REP element-mobilizing transposase RayT